MNTQAGKSISVPRIVVAVSVGNALEWFDIAIYAYFAVYISQAFFPAENATVSMLLTFGTFGASYLARPLGGIVLGAYADRKGRKAALLMSVGLMMLGTAMIAMMPTYAQIGLAGPIGIFIARLIQGFSAGGEFGASTAMLIEHAPHRRGLIASWQFATQGLATLLASSFGFALAVLMPADELTEWGWRIPFFFGLLIGPVGLYLRRFLDDAPDFKEAERTATPVRDVFGPQKFILLASVGILTVSTATSYLLQYIPTFTISELDLPASTGFAAAIFSSLILTVVTPISGHLSDSIGRLRQMAIASVLLLVSVYPAFSYATAHANITTLFILVGWLSILKAFYFGALPALMSEVFPISTRATGMSISYNVGVTLFGGLTPMTIVWLIGATGSKAAPGAYLALTAAISLTALMAIGKFRMHARFTAQPVAANPLSHASAGTQAHS